MPLIVYSLQFDNDIMKVDNELDAFFYNVPQNQPSLQEYRRNLRHFQDLERFKDTVDGISSGQRSLAKATVGVILSGRTVCILAHGPWRGYFQVMNDGTIVGLQFIDCR